MKILNLLPFVVTDMGDIGIAVAGPFASSAWMQSHDLFQSIGGTKFAWLAPDGTEYTDHRDLFKRPTGDQVIKGLSEVLLKKGVEMGYLESTEQNY